MGGESTSFFHCRDVFYTSRKRRRENSVAQLLLRSWPRRSEGQHLAALIPISALASLCSRLSITPREEVSPGCPTSCLLLYLLVHFAQDSCTTCREPVQHVSFAPVGICRGRRSVLVHRVSVAPDASFRGRRRVTIGSGTPTRRTIQSCLGTLNKSIKKQLYGFQATRI